MDTLVLETEKRPYFLYGALAVPALWITYFAFVITAGFLIGNRSSSDMANWGLAMIVFFCALVVSEIIGLACSIISVVRHEKFRKLGIACLVIYALPALCFGSLYILNLGAERGQQVMNEMPKKSHSP